MVGLGVPAGGGIAEGDYTSWVFKWLWAPVAWLYAPHTSFYIDEVNSIFYLWWEAAAADQTRFGVYNLSDHSTVFESAVGSDYLAKPPFIGAGDYSFYLGVCCLSATSISRSHQTYMLLCRQDYETMEVWRNGVKLWTHKASDDTPEAFEKPATAVISLTGKYIMAALANSNKLIFYEGT